MPKGYVKVFTNNQGQDQDGFVLAQCEYTGAGASAVLTPGQEGEYNAATTKVKVSVETRLSTVSAVLVTLNAKVAAAKTLEVKVGPKAALKALTAPENGGASAALIEKVFVVPVGQYFEVVTTGVEGEPTYSFIAL